MKKKVLVLLIAALCLMCGCSKKEAEPAEAATPAKEEEVVEVETEEAAVEENVAIGNPWVSCSEPEIFEKLGLSMYAPGGAADVSCQMNESDGLAEMTFKYGEPELEYTFRTKKCKDFEDISGLYYEWDVVDELQVGWCDGETRRAITESETVDSCLWFDKDIEIMYSLSTAAADLDGFDITAIVYQIFLPEDESEVFMPANFLEANVQKDIFESYDEIISLLDKGNAYAIVKVYGLDEDVLMITEGTYDYGDGNMAAIDASLYRNDNGQVKNIGNVFSSGTAYPISLDKDGRIYSGGNHEVSVEVISEETQAVMSQIYAYETFDENENTTYGGFVRADNKVYEDGADIGFDDPSVLEKCYEDYAKTEPVSFKVVE